MGDIKDLIKIVSPDIHSSGSDKAKKKFKKLLSEANNINETLTLLKKTNDDDIKSIKPKSLLSYSLTYDAQTNQLEPIYYWILDFIQDAGYKIEKVTDNFMATPGSGSFDEYGRKAGTAQEKAMTYLGAINQVTKSIIQLIYDLKDFEMRIKQYDNAHSKNKTEKYAAIQGLKQVWMDSVDSKKGNTGIKAMAFSASPFALLIDSFLMIEDERLKDMNGNEIDLNERVKNVLRQKIAEFNIWVELSESEIRKRFQVEKSYLRTQVETLRLYTSWVRPYLESAEKLRQQGFEKNAAMVNAFSTSMFELTLLAKKGIKVSKPFNNYKLSRDYNAVLLVSFKYRGHYSQRISQKGDMAYGFGGRVDISFDAYALNSEELDILNKLKEIEEKALGFSFVQEESDKALEQLQKDIDHFLDEEEKEKKKEKKSQDDINPFSALFDIFKGSSSKSKKKDKPEKPGDIKGDSYVEGYARNEAEKSAKGFLYAVYDIYKKAHGMASSPEEFDS